MKRTFLVLLLILCLLLCSCAPAISGDQATTPPDTEPTSAPTQPTEPPTQPTEPLPPDFPMGATGEKTDGALRCLPLDIGVRCEAYLWGDAMLFFNAHKIQLRSLQDGSLLASVPGIDANSVTVTDEYIIYYIYPKHQIIFRDKNLDVKTVGVSVSSDVADMLFSQDGSKAFYHIYYDSNTIVELDIQTGEKRVIPVDGAPIWSLSGFAFNTLYYWGKEDNQDYYAFVELSSGEYLGKDTQITKLQTWDNGYYLCRAENGRAKHQIVIESTERYIEVRDHEDLHYNTWALPQVNSLFALHSGYESSAVILELYDLTTGACTASLTVDLGQPYQQATGVFADPSGEYIWLCLKVGNTSDYQMVLYRWDFQANAVAE